MAAALDARYLRYSTYPPRQDKRGTLEVRPLWSHLRLSVMTLFLCPRLCGSGLKEERVAASAVLEGPREIPSIDKAQIIADTKEVSHLLS